MINLLPPVEKEELRAAQSNTKLRYYLVVTVLYLAGVFGVFGGAFYLNNTFRQTYTAAYTDTQNRLEDLREVQQKTKTFNDNLAKAKRVYASQIKVSEVLTRISEKLPPGAILNGIALNTNEFNKPLTVVAKVNSIKKAAILKANFDESGYFTNVKIQGITNSPDADPQYPNLVTMTVNLAPSLTSPLANKGNQP